MQIKDYFIMSNKDSFPEIEQESIEKIKDFICNHYESLKITYDKEKREIEKTSRSVPQFCPKADNPGLQSDTIYLAIKDFTYWCQVIFQLSHELTHCFIYINNKSKAQKASWIEESICEMMAYYFLQYFADKWDDCGLWRNNNSYADSIRVYLDGEKSCESTQCLSSCKNYVELMKIEKTSEDRRQDRHYEVGQMFELLSTEDILGLIRYKDYIKADEKILDTESYRKAYPQNRVVQYLCDLQERILRE